MALKILKESKFLARHATIYAIGNFLNRIVVFLLLPVYTRFLTTTDYGIKNLVGLSIDIIGVLLAGIIASGVLRFYYEYKDIKERNEVISSAVIAIGCIGLFAIALLSFSTKTLAFYIIDDAELYYFFDIALISMWFQSLNNVGYDYLRINQLSLKFIKISFLKLIINFFLNIYFVCFVKIGVLGILISTLITSIIIFALLMVPLLINIGLHFSKDKIVKMAKFSYPLIISQIGAFVVHLSDRFFIKAMLSVSDVGLYSLGYRFGTLPGDFISDPFNRTWQPRRFELYKKEGSERIFGKIFTYYLFLIFFVGLIISVLTKDVLMIIADSAFWSAYKVVPIIVLANIIYNFSAHVNMGLLIKNKTKYFAYINFSNGFFILLLNFLLIPRYGVFGAAYATLIAFIYKISLTYYFSSKHYKIHFEFIRIGKILLSATVVYILTVPIEFASVYNSFVVKMSIILLYPVLLFGVGLFTIEEKQKMVDFIKPKFLAVKKFLA